MENTICKVFPYLVSVIGHHNIKYFLKCKSIFSSLVYRDLDGRLKIITKNEMSPELPDDWLMYLAIRSYCRTWLITGKLLRDEKDAHTFDGVNFMSEELLEKYFYAGKDYYMVSRLTEEVKLKFNYSRKIFIMSKSLTVEDLLSINLFKQKYCSKTIINNTLISKEVENEPSLQKFLEDNNISLVNFNKDKTINEMIECLKKEYAAQDDSPPILVEIGPSTLLDALREDVDTIDLFVITVFNGRVHDSCIGIEFPSIEVFYKRGYKLVNLYEKETDQGLLQFYTFVINKLL